MSAKILCNTKTYKPVTIELTFDTIEQLECFYKIYENPYETARKLFDDYGDKIADTIDKTIDVKSIEQLDEIIDMYRK